MSKSIDQFEEEKGILKIFMDFDAFVYPWIPKVSTDRINIMNTKYFIALFPKKLICWAKFKTRSCSILNASFDTFNAKIGQLLTQK